MPLLPKSGRVWATSPRFGARAKICAVSLLGALSLVGVSSTMFTSACSVQPDAPRADRQQMLVDLTNNVLLPLYSDVATQSEQLAAATTALRATPTADALERAQTLYRTARASQKTTECTLYDKAPSNDISVTSGAIDAWPADGSKIEALLSSTASLTPADVARLGATQRGFPALEQLLFDSSVSAAEVLARFTATTSGARRLEFTESVARDLATLTKKVSDAWGGPTGYGNELATAGTTSKLYPEQSLAVDQVLTGMLYAAELVELKKLAKPLGIDNSKTTNMVTPAFEEGPRSDSSIADIQATMNGMQAIYTGSYGTHVGTGVGTTVRDMNVGADMRYAQAFTSAVAAVAAIPAPYRTTLVTNPGPLSAATTAAQAVDKSIQMDLAGALAASLGFGFSDSD